jgi:hypothetical protein
MSGEEAAQQVVFQFQVSSDGSALHVHWKDVWRLQQLLHLSQFQQQAPEKVYECLREVADEDDSITKEGFESALRKIIDVVHSPSRRTPCSALCFDRSIEPTIYRR